MAVTLTNNGLYQGTSPVLVNQAGNITNIPKDLLPLLGLPGQALSLAQGGNPVSGALDTVKDTASAAVSSTKAVIAAGQWLSNRDNWIRVAKVVLGAAMVIEGLAMLIAKPTLSAQTIAAAAKVVK